MTDKSDVNLIEKIQETLEDIKSILLLANQEKLDLAKKALLKEGSIEEQVYKLCDGEKTTQDISNIIKKSNEYTGAVISTLRHKGLVKTLQKENKKIHEQVL